MPSGSRGNSVLELFPGISSIWSGLYLDNVTVTMGRVESQEEVVIRSNIEVWG
jgi:hypothetical protein